MTVDETTKEIRFLCSFNATFSDMEYIVQWYINNRMVQEEVFTNEQNNALKQSSIGQLLYEDQVNTLKRGSFFSKN
jgi:hypothetical protein